MHQPVQRLAHPGQLYQLSQVGRFQVVVPVPRDLLAFELANDNLREETELTERALAEPAPEEEKGRGEN